VDESLIEKMIDLKYSRRDETVFVRAKGCCEYCDVNLIHNRIAWDSIQFDHIIPKSKGGGEEDENLALSCKVCNNAKMVFIPEGDTRRERIASARNYASKVRENANKFWVSVSDIFREHGYT